MFFLIALLHTIPAIEPMNSQDQLPEDPVHDPDNYRLGIFYYCKSDIRLMPPKRFKNAGWEINFAHPKAGLLLIGIMAGSMLLALFCILVASWLM